MIGIAAFGLRIASGHLNGGADVAIGATDPAHFAAGMSRVRAPNIYRLSQLVSPVAPLEFNMNLITLLQEPVNAVLAPTAGVNPDHDPPALVWHQVQAAFGGLHQRRNQRTQARVTRVESIHQDFIVLTRQDSHLLSTIGAPMTRKVLFGGLLGMLARTLSLHIDVQNKEVLLEIVLAG